MRGLRPLCRGLPDGKPAVYNGFYAINLCAEIRKLNDRRGLLVSADIHSQDWKDAVNSLSTNVRPSAVDEALRSWAAQIYLRIYSGVECLICARTESPISVLFNI